MARLPHATATTLRNRSRITNKSRLKIISGSIEIDEDDEDVAKANLISTAGVDLEDANEHHLQAVLSAASTSQNEGSSKPSAAFIPTPDSTGVVANYDELYAQRTWKDDEGFNAYSMDTDQSVAASLQEGFTYYLDERDKAWLDRNNESARGEGTSAKGALSPSACAGASPRGKGKEPEAPSSTTITEDQFELVMGIFERVTHDKTAYLHHSFDPNVSFPAFSDYEDTFSRPLPPSLFTVYRVPTWVPELADLARIARIIYPHWKQRRIQRAGHRIQPSLNYDESDTQNESYICFRRREIKAVRKTRASQATSNDKLLRLHAELVQLEDIAKLTLMREQATLESTRKAQGVWDKRVAFVETLRKDPSLYTKADDELLVDKERPPKRPRVDITSRSTGLKIRAGRETNDNVAPVVEVVRPKERVRCLQQHIDRDLARMKEEDKQWDDQVDNPYQLLPVPYSSRLYKFIPPKDAPQQRRDAHAVRMRYGRGGRMHVDRRRGTSAVSSHRDLLRMPEYEDMEDDEQAQRLLVRWRFDMDDQPSVGPDGSEEKDRMLIDDRSARFSHHIPSLFAATDLSELSTINEIPLTHSDGRPRIVQPFRLGLPIRREYARPPGHLVNGVPQPQPIDIAPPPVNGTPVSQRIQPPTNGMRLPSNGTGPISGIIMGGAPNQGGGPPNIYPANGEQVPQPRTQPSSDLPLPLRPNQYPNGNPSPNGNTYPPKIPHIVPIEGFPTNGAGAWNATNHAGLSVEQRLSLKAVLGGAAGGPQRVSYVGGGGNVPMNLKLPPSRAMQYKRGAVDGQESNPNPAPVHPNGV